MLADQGASLLQSTVVAALVAGAVALATLAWTSRRDRQDRQRKLFADAFESCIAYREYPYIVRRRSAEDPASELIRISGKLSRVQMRFQSFHARLRVEAPRVGEAYRLLITETKRVAGSQISAGWDTPVGSSDAEAHVRGIDYSELVPWDDRYLNEVADHLSAWPRWFHAWIRRWTAKRSDSAAEVRASQGDEIDAGGVVGS